MLKKPLSCGHLPALPLTLLILLTLTGCSLKAPVWYPQAQKPEQSQPTVPADAPKRSGAFEPVQEAAEPAPELPQRPAAVQPGPAHRLYTQAEAAMASGLLEQAEMLMERALRIEPRNALYWHTLAQVKYDKGEFEQTVQLCLKSESLARDNPELHNVNRILMERADKRR